jgi:hypothetical protein
VGQILGRPNSISDNIKTAEDPLLSTFELSIDAASIDTHHPELDADL